MFCTVIKTSTALMSLEQLQYNTTHQYEAITARKPRFTLLLDLLD